MFMCTLFAKLGKFSAITYCNIPSCHFLSSPSGHPQCVTLAGWMVSQGLLGSVHLHPICTLFCYLHSVILTVLYLNLLIISSACSNLPLNLSSKFLFQKFVLLSFEAFSLLILPLLLYTIFLTFSQIFL